MGNLKIFSQQWPIKTLIGIVFASFSPVWAAFTILLMLILIDTITGITQAIQLKRFSSRFLRKVVKKTITYSVCILTTRLLEQGFDFFFQTTVITQTIIGFLIVTEAISILENLALMGVPLPRGIVDIILKNLQVAGVGDLVKESLNEAYYLKEIDEIIYYQLPTFKNENLKKLLQIMCEIWAKQIIFIKTNLDVRNITSNDILYYKIMSYIETSIKEKEEKWQESGISNECIERFNKWHEERVTLYLQSIKSVCYAEKTLEEKNQELADRVMVLAYQTMTDAHKSEQELNCPPCTNCKITK
jgi:toxin secretion/phage lysis holin